VVRDLNSFSNTVFGSELQGNEIGVVDLPADPSVSPVRLTVYRPEDPDYAALDALAVRTGRNQKRQAVLAAPPAFVPPWAF